MVVHLHGQEINNNFHPSIFQQQVSFHLYKWSNLSFTPPCFHRSHFQLLASDTISSAFYNLLLNTMEKKERITGRRKWQRQSVALSVSYRHKHVSPDSRSRRCCAGAGAEPGEPAFTCALQHPQSPRRNTHTTPQTGHRGCSNPAGRHIAASARSDSPKRIRSPVPRHAFIFITLVSLCLRFKRHRLAFLN